MVPDSFKGPEHGVLAVLRVEWDIPKLLKATSVWTWSVLLFMERLEGHTNENRARRFPVSCNDG
jgi:hypothetical protein